MVGTANSNRTKAFTAGWNMSNLLKGAGTRYHGKFETQLTCTMLKTVAKTAMPIISREYFFLPSGSFLHLVGRAVLGYHIARLTNTTHNIDNSSKS